MADNMLEGYEILSYEGMAELNNIQYISSSCFNALIIRDKISKECKIKKFFSVGIPNSVLLHGKIFLHGHKLICTPNFSQGIHIYDIQTNEMNYIKIYNNNGKEFHGADSFIIDNKLWLFFSYSDYPIMSMDLDNFEISTHEELSDPIFKLVGRERHAIWFQMCKSGSDLYAVIDDTQFLVHIDLESMITKIFTINSNGHLSGVAVNEEFAYFTEYWEKRIIKYSFKDGKTKYLDLDKSIEFGIDNGIIYSNILCVDKKIIIIPNHYNKVLTIDDNVIKTYMDFPADYKDHGDDLRKNWRRFHSYEIKKDTLFLYPSRSKMLFKYDIKNKMLESEIYSISTNGLGERFITEHLYENNADVLHENNITDLKSFLNVVSGKK